MSFLAENETRAEYRKKHREKILAALPATVSQVCKATSRARGSILHHLDQMIADGLVRKDEREYPIVYRRAA